LALSQEIVNSIEEARKMDLGEGMKPCENRRKSKERPWGPIVVDRQRRQNDGTSMLQRAL
jgi:hypothetical protein